MAIPRIDDIENRLPLVAILEDRKSSGINGGTSVADGIQTRTLNTLNGDTDFVTLLNGTTGTDGTANRFSLDSGKYTIRCIAPAFKTNQSQLNLYDFTNSLIIKSGRSGHTASGDNTNVDLTVDHVLSIASTTEFELHHYTNTSTAVNGLGVTTSSFAGNPATYNIYSSCVITKIG